MLILCQLFQFVTVDVELLFVVHVPGNINVEMCRTAGIAYDEPSSMQHTATLTDGGVY